MWECPDFFALGDKHVLLISTMGKVRWKVGSYANQRFEPQKEGVVDWGAYYAAKSMLDADGNRILWGWITETRPDSELIAAGWAGAMSLPRVLSLNSENELQTDVAPAAHQLRGAHTSMNPQATSAAQLKILDALRIHDLAAELKLELSPKAEAFSIHLQSETGEEFATISCTNKIESRHLRINTVAAPLPGTAGSRVSLHVFLDGSVLEVFANETTSITARIYHIPTGALRLKLEGNVELHSLDVWQISPISKDRLTASLCR
jgi:beta-fructofuranosidase